MPRVVANMTECAGSRVRDIQRRRQHKEIGKARTQTLRQTPGSQMFAALTMMFCVRRATSSVYCGAWVLPDSGCFFSLYGRRALSEWHRARKNSVIRD